MNTVCLKNKCTGCKACLDSCVKNAITIIDNGKNINAVIDDSKCVSCKRCNNVCQINNEVTLQKPILWKQGWSGENKIRQSSSSGGFATAIAKRFIEKGGVVAACVFGNATYTFTIIESVDEIMMMSGSKYIKSNPEGIYKKVEHELKSGRDVLFIGLPCQVAALKNYIRESLYAKLYTIDLICHGSPAESLLKKYLSEHNIDANKVSDIAFRSEKGWGLSVDKVALSKYGSLDKYMLAFLKGLSYTDNCYSCRYATSNRVSDITLGDSWGTGLKNEERKGISLALCQTEKGCMLLQDSDLQLFDVDLENAIKHNGQLRQPSIEPKNRNTFFKEIGKGKSFEYAVFRAFPKLSIHIWLHDILVAMHIKN